MAKYPYQNDPARHKVPRPILPIKLGYKKTGKTTIPIRALVDSGADVCMCAQEVATWLGVEFDGTEKQFSIVTANGSASQAIRKNITLITQEKQYQCPFFFVEGINPMSIPLLGQQGFFDHFKICFNFQDKVFEVL